MLQGTSADDMLFSEERPWEGQPRQSWRMRKRREKAALRSGLAEWQANPYYCAGRVTVPAVLDTFACQCFFNRHAIICFHLLLPSMLPPPYPDVQQPQS